MLMMKINLRDRQSSRLRLQWTEERNFVTFQDVWWVRISITTHYNSIHMIINSTGLDWQEDTWEPPWKHADIIITMSLSQLFRSCSASFLCELHSC